MKTILKASKKHILIIIFCGLLQSDASWTAKVEELKVLVYKIK